MGEVGKPVWKSSASLKHPSEGRAPFVAKQPRLNRQAPGALTLLVPPLLPSFAVGRVALPGDSSSRELPPPFSQAPAGRRGNASLRSLEQGLLPWAVPGTHALAGFTSPPRHLLRPYASHAPPKQTTIRSTGVFVHKAVTLQHMASQTQTWGCQKNSDAWGVGVGWG